MKAKKIWALLMAFAMVFSLAACGDTAEDTSDADNADAENTDTAEASDLAYVQDKGTLVVGITEFEPMDYQNESGEWVGFDADLAKEFAESLGVEVQFQIIDWDSKIMELDGKTIDVVWNGMTLTEDVTSAMECSQPYLINQQVVVVPAAVADQYQSEDSLTDLAFAVEIGSAGCEIAAANGYNYTEVADQATALLEVASGTADAAIIDSLMAGAMNRRGHQLCRSDLHPGSHQRGVRCGLPEGFRPGRRLNEFLDGKYADGSIQTLAETYGVQDALVQE